MRSESRGMSVGEQGLGSNVLDPARYGPVWLVWARRADRPVCSPEACEERASGGMSACECFRNGVLGG
eukprot:400534-Prymnesium_polylepis.1